MLHSNRAATQRFNDRNAACPPQKKIYLESYGCTANEFDLEIMMAYLEKDGHRIVRDVSSANLILINSCGVKKNTEDRIIERLRVLAGLGKPIIVTGCLPKINREAIISIVPQFSAMLDPSSIDKISLAVQSALKGEKGKLFFCNEPLRKLEQPKVRPNRYVEIIVISEGCTGSCSFCCVRFARGRLNSYPIDAIVNRTKQAIDDGAKEIWLTSQDTGSYGKDKGASLPELLSKCCRIEGSFFIRVGMMNPNHVLKSLSDLIEVYKNERLFKFLHIPVQSGDDETLRRMNRLYKVQDFTTIVEEFRRNIPNITLATDVICGFPGESRDAFEATLELIKELKPDVVNISRFFARPNTIAEKMQQIEDKELNWRSSKMSNIAGRTAYDRNLRWLGWKGEVLVDEIGTEGSYIGRNYAYKPIVVKNTDDLLGKFVQIRVVKAYSKYLEGEIIKT